MTRTTLIQTCGTFLAGMLLLMLPQNLAAQCTPPNVSFTDTISLCQGNSITLDVTTGDNPSYTWSTGQSSASITVSTSGTYWVEVTNNCGTDSDTVVINIDPLIIPNLGADRDVCSTTGDTLSLQADPNTSYLWQDNSTSNEFYVSQSGTYWVEVSNACGTFTDSVNITVQPPPDVNLGPDITNCNTGTVTITLPDASGGTVLWSDASSGDSLVVDSAGTYWVEVTHACGVFSDTIDVIYDTLQGIDIGDSISKCSGDAAIISANVTGGTYSWSTGESSSAISVQNPGTYWLEFTNACGSFRDTVVVEDITVNFDLGNDTTVCDFLRLQIGIPDADVIWWDNRTRHFHFARDTGTFWVGVSRGCGYVYDTIHVNVMQSPSPSSSIQDTVYICPGDSIKLDAGAYGYGTSYLWSNGSVTQTSVFSASGSEWVKVQNDCDTIQVDFQVALVPNESNFLGPDTAICARSIRLSSNKTFPQGTTYNWSPEGGPVIDSSGTYWLQVFTPCDTLSDTIQVTLSPNPDPIPEDSIDMCAGSSVYLSPPQRENATYNWSTGQSTDSIQVSQPGKYWFDAYGACDTISDTVYVKEVFPITSVFGNDTSFCEPNNILLDVSQFDADSIYWGDGSDDTQKLIDSTGSFKVELYNACGMFEDSIHVQVDLLPDTIVSDTSFCYNSSVTVSAQQPQVKTYSWSTGESTPSISISQEGQYYVDMTSDCGTVTDTFHIGKDTIITPFTVGPDTVLCGPTLLLDPGDVGGTHYVWQDSIPGRQFVAATTGTYWVTARNACNSYTDTIDVIITGPPRLVLGNEVRFCEGTSVTLNAQNELLGEFQWNTGDTTQRITVDSAGTYWVTITNNCGQKTDTIEVIVEYPLNDLDLGEDTVVCQNDSLILWTPNPAADALWNTGETTDSISVDTTGTYWVRKTNSCGSFFDTIYIEVLEPFSFSLGKDSAFCREDTNSIFSGPEGFETYYWSTGDSTRSISIDSAADYWLTASNGCFSYTDTVRLVPEESFVVDLGQDTTLCFGQSLVLRATDSDNEVIWHDNTNDSIKEITRSGTYWAFGSNTCGSFHDTIHVQFDVPLSPPDIDSSFCRGDTVLIDFSPFNVEVEWEDGSTDSAKTFVEEQEVKVTLKNICGSYEQRINLILQNCSCPFHIPNAFTPDGNNVNETFQIKHSCNLRSFRIEIMTRLGRKVFSSSDINRSWDGRTANEPAPQGFYVYKIKYSWEVDGVVRYREESGTLSLIR